MTDNLKGVITDEAIQALRTRNQARADAAIQAMGTGYVCHPANRIERRAPEPEQRPLNEVSRMLARVFN